MKAGGGIETKITVEWGGKEGTTVSGSASGRVEDDKGNYAEVEVTQDSDGEGSVTISAGHEE